MHRNDFDYNAIMVYFAVLTPATLSVFNLLLFLVESPLSEIVHFNRLFYCSKILAEISEILKFESYFRHGEKLRILFLP